jgi:DNA-binding NarL/FixJ family response regulator
MITGIKIIVVDDNQTFLEGIISLLKCKSGYQVIAKYHSGDELLKAGTKVLLNADIILIDIEMPGKNGIEVTHFLNQRFPDLKFIAITMYQDKVYLEQLVANGFRGFVNKTKVSQKLHSTINLVMNNKYVFPEELDIIK